MVSIVVPVYNAEPYLPELIQSVIDQDYRDWQLILIDDGSTDRSGEICDRYSEADPRIVVKHVPNSGVAAARNTGLELVEGEYVAFFDSDDRVEPDCLSLLVGKIRETDADLAVASFFVDADGRSELHDAPANGILDRKSFDRMLRSGHDIYWRALWNKLFKSTLIKENGLQFPKGLSMCEDVLFVLQYCKAAETICCLDRGVYHYCQRNSASLTHKFNPDRLRGFDLAEEAMKELAAAKGYPALPNEEEFCRFRSDTLAAYVYTAFMDGRVGKEKRRSVYNELKACKTERRYMRSSDGLSTRIIGRAPYSVLKIYFALRSRK